MSVSEHWMLSAAMQCYLLLSEKLQMLCYQDGISSKESLHSSTIPIKRIISKH